MAKLPSKIMAKKRGRYQSDKKNDRPTTKTCKQIRSNKQYRTRRNGS